MKHLPLLLSAVLALTLSACGQEEEVALPSPLPPALSGAVVVPKSVNASGSALIAKAALEHPIVRDELRAIDLPIIMYHYVEPVYDPSDKLGVSLTTTPEDFEAQLKALSEGGFTFYTVSDVPALMARTITPADKRVILSFDDGYADFYAYVFPLLKKYHVKATLYIITDVLGTSDYLTADQVRELARSGLVEIGDHTLTHPDLPTLSPAQQAAQILESKKKLEAIIGGPVATFAYPFGHYNDESIRLAGSGYIASVSVKPGRLQTPADIQLLRRLRPDSLKGASLKLFLKGSDGQ